MENEEMDVADISNQQEEADLNTANEDNFDQEEGEDVDDVKARLQKAEELAQNYKIRAEKAERQAKVKPEATPKPQQSNDLTTKDLYALIDAKVPEDDIEEVREYANLKKISISEALKSTVVRTILNEKAEERNVANASNVGSSKRSSGKVPDDVLLSRASKGELPDNDADLERLIKLRKGIK